MGAGILPVTMSNGILLFLMGKERSNNLWCDFGGSTESGEQPIQTAIREGGEELNGILELDNKLYNKVAESMISPVEFNKYTSLFEKSEIKWFTINELKRNINKFRPHYIPIVNTIIYHESTIKSSVMCYNRMKNLKVIKNKYSTIYRKK